MDMDSSSAVLVVMATIKALHENSDIRWDHMVTALLTSSAYAAKEAGYTSEEYLQIINTISIKSIDDCNLLDNCIGRC